MGSAEISQSHRTGDSLGQLVAAVDEPDREGPTTSHLDAVGRGQAGGGGRVDDVAIERAVAVEDELGVAGVDGPGGDR
jgi:hypothetical protein